MDEWLVIVWMNGCNSWNCKRYHHLNPHQLTSGEWVAVVDADRVPSGDLEVQHALRVEALLIIFLLSFMVGLVSGYGRC